MDVVGGRTGVTAEQLPAILADPTELHVVIILFLRVSPNLLEDLLTLRIVLLCLPLDAFLLLKSRTTESGYNHPPPAQLDHAQHLSKSIPKPKAHSQQHQHVSSCPGPPRLRLGTHAVWAAPLALRRLLHVWVQADHVVRAGTRVTQDDLSALLAHLTIVLVVCLITIHSSHLLLAWARKRESPVIRKQPPPPTPEAQAPSP